MRIRARWNKHAKQQSLEDIAGAISLICWKIATNGVLELENQGCQTDSNAQRLQIIGEFLAVLLQVTDRLVYESLEGTDRHRFITSLGLQMTDTYADNQQDVLGTGNHRQTFLDLLNQRTEDYSELSFNEGEAGFDFLRYFGEQVETVVKGQNWVGQQVMDKEGPAAIKTLKSALQGLMR